MSFSTSGWGLVNEARCQKINRFTAISIKHMNSSPRLIPSQKVAKNHMMLTVGLKLVQRSKTTQHNATSTFPNQLQARKSRKFKNNKKSNNLKSVSSTCSHF